MRKLTKTQMTLATLGAVALGGLTVASAVSLSIAANHDLAAGQSVTQTCQTGEIGVAFDEPAWNAATQKFTVASVNLSNLTATCDGFDVKIVVAGDAGVSLGAVDTTIAATAGAQSFTLPTSIPSDDVESINVVIY